MEKELPEYVSIKHWAEDDKPREKLEANGARVLSDAELMAILIRSGSAKRSAVDLARDILKEHDNDLAVLARASVRDLTRFPGMGKVKAITISAALELGRRRRDTVDKGRSVIGSSQAAFEIMRPTLEDLPHEEFWVMLLDRGNAFMSQQRVGQGGLHGTVADPKVIFKRALERQASGVILFHNHPSGQLRPSEADIALTRKLVEGGKLLDIVVHDHIIIAGQGFFSFADQGML